MPGLTVRQLIAKLQQMPQDVTVFFPDSELGDRQVRVVEDTESYVCGARIVRLREVKDS